MSSFIETLRKELIKNEERGELLRKLLSLEGPVPVDRINSVEPEEPPKKVIKFQLGKPAKQRKRRIGDVSSEILGLFDTKFDKAVKMPVIQSAYFELTGKDNLIDGLVRKLRVKGELACVQYNDSQRLVFFGKPEWVNETDFKPQYKPSNMAEGLTPKIIKQDGLPK